MKRTLITVAVTAATTLAITAGSITLAFSVQPTLAGNEFLLLKPEQAKECADGGGCAVFSEREFKMAVMGFLRQMQVQQGHRGDAT